MRKWSNKPKMSKFWPLTFKKQPFERFNQILLMICCLCHPKEASCKKRKKVIEQILRKWSNKPKMSKFWPLTFTKQPFEWFNQILLMICCLCHPKEASCKKRKKVIEQFWENGLTNQKCQNFDLWPSRNNPSSDSTKSYLWYVVYVIPKKLHAKKEKKLLNSFWENQL